MALAYSCLSLLFIFVRILFVGLLLFVAFDYARVLNLRRKMPPGPFPRPLIGNRWMVPRIRPWIKYEEWSNKYKSPIITVWLGSRPTVILNDAWVASDLLDKRASIYSSRPRMIIMGDITDLQSFNLIAMKYGPQWRLHRKLHHMGVGSHLVKGYRQIQNDESKVLASHLLRQPEEYVAALERYASSVVSIISYARRLPTIDDYLVKEVLGFMKHGARFGVPGIYLVETFPWLARLPKFLIPWKAQMKASMNAGTDFFYRLAVDARDHGREDCFAKKVFQVRDEHNLSDQEVSTISGNLFGGGTDTSSSTLVTFVLAMCAFPDVAAKAQEEIDRVVGHHRSPNFEDDLPYVRAVVAEVFRWRSTAIIGGQPHAPIQDDYYKGYLIPQDTFILGNLYGIHHNDRDFPDPDRFMPERFLPDDPAKRPFPNSRGYMAFGWGKRVCSGQPFAEQGIYITVARLLWGFTIRNALDENGNEIPVDIFDYETSLNTRPAPFNCRIIARNSQIRKTIDLEAEQALADLSRYEYESSVRMPTFFT